MFFRRSLAKKRLAAAEANKDLKWDLLDAMNNVKTCWGEVTAKTIRNCFANVGFVRPAEEEDEGNPFDECESDEEEQVAADRNIWDRYATVFIKSVKTHSHGRIVW